MSYRDGRGKEGRREKMSAGKVHTSSPFYVSEVFWDRVGGERTTFGSPELKELMSP
jgi:hypothetical protein